MENKQSKPTRQQVILSPVNYCLTKKDVTEANSDESIVDSNRKRQGNKQLHIIYSLHPKKNVNLISRGVKSMA